jgi:hypothetical protein
MIKYIVIWILATTVQVPCPDAGKVDEFGRNSGMYNSCSVLHTSTDYDTLQQEFLIKEKAELFYDNAKKEVTKGFSFFLGSDIIQVEMYEMKLIKIDKHN